MSTQKNEHNPDPIPQLWMCDQENGRDFRIYMDGKSTEQVYTEFRRLADQGRDVWLIHQGGVKELPDGRRITPPTETTGSGMEGETVPKDHVIDRSAPIETQLAQAEAWVAQLQQSYRSIQQTCTNKDAQVEALRRVAKEFEKQVARRLWTSDDGVNIRASDPGDYIDDDPALATAWSLFRSAIDSAQRQEKP